MSGNKNIKVANKHAEAKHGCCQPWINVTNCNQLRCGMHRGDYKEKAPSFKASHNVFGNESESEDEPTKKPILLRPSDNINRQAKITQERAIIEDPTVYQYDEIYDTLASKKETKTMQSKEEKKPKYIENLIKTANKRKLEHERRVERQVANEHVETRNGRDRSWINATNLDVVCTEEIVSAISDLGVITLIQKEREKEGDEFADKEIFVTSAYKKKLEELRQEEEKEKYEEYLESIGDVTRQKDLGGFYRHLYEQKLGPKEPITTDIKNQSEKDNNEKDSEKSVSINVQSSSKTRNYRKRKISRDSNKKLSEGEIDDSEEEINRCNLADIRTAKKNKQLDPNIDADSDFSIDESSDEDDNNTKNTDIKPPVSTPPKPNIEDNKNIETDAVLADAIVQPKVKIDIWKKRTVEEVFDQALKRYYERKAARGI